MNRASSFVRTTVATTRSNEGSSTSRGYRRPSVGSAPPLVSVLVAVHDGARHLEPAITSVLRQTVHDLELVVVDDASSDETPASLRGVRDPRLIVVRNDERLGLAGALNVGLDRCRGRYVARMDGDDIAFPEWLERQLRELHDQPQLAMVGGRGLDVCRGARGGRVRL